MKMKKLTLAVSVALMAFMAPYTLVVAADLDDVTMQVMEGDISTPDEITSTWTSQTLLDT